MRHDTQIVQSFLSGHNHAYGTDLRLSEIPDLGGRRSGVDGIAQDGSNRSSWAIEHTLLEPFLGEQEDTLKFLEVFAPLEADPELILPGWRFELYPRAGVVPKGVSWDTVRAAVRSWFVANRGVFSAGSAKYLVPGLPFDMEILIHRTPSEKPSVLVGRRDIPETRGIVVRKALSRKLPKLIATPADQHILIFEKADLYTGYVGITRSVDGLFADFPQLALLDRIWVALSCFAKTDDTLFFLSVWPHGVTAKFKSKWSSLSEAA